jgi:hypothetical protein
MVHADLESMPRQRNHLLSWFALALAPLQGCGILGPNEDRVVGLIDASDIYRPPLEFPDTVDSHGPFSLTVWTTGDGCTRGGDTEMVISARTVSVTPFDIVTRADACTTPQLYFEHQVSVTLEGTGPVQILVRARGFPSGSALELEGELWVR